MSGYPVLPHGPSFVTATLPEESPAVGTVKRFSDGNQYRLVYNAGNSQISPGQGAVVSAVSGYSVTVSSTVSAMAGGIGVCKHATLTTATYGWLLVEGFATAEAHANAGLTAGEGLSLAGDGVFVNASGITGPIYGKAMASTASAGSSSAYFNFLGA